VVPAFAVVSAAQYSTSGAQRGLVQSTSDVRVDIDVVQSEFWLNGHRSYETAGGESLMQTSRRGGDREPGGSDMWPAQSDQSDQLVSTKKSSANREAVLHDLRKQIKRQKS